MLSLSQTAKFTVQAGKDARAWAMYDSNHNKRSKEVLDAFEAGVRQGYSAAIGDMRLHGYKFKEN